MASPFELLLMAQTAQLLPPVTATPNSTTSNGTPTPSGGTETFDTVLGYYQCTLIAGRRYLAVSNGNHGNGTAGELYSMQIRDSGSSSSPTTSSTLIAQSEWYCPAGGSGGRGIIPLAGSFIASTSGVHTFGVSSLRLVGSNVFTPVPGSLTGASRELYVM